MKTEELTALGLSAEQAQQVLALAGRDIEKHKNEAATLRTQLSTAQQQLDNANSRLEGYDPDWKTKAEQARTAAEAQLADLRLDYAIDAAIREAGGRNPKAIRALLNRGDLKLTESGAVLGLTEQLDGIKKDSDYLFASAEPAPHFAASATGAGQNPPLEGNAAANAALRSILGRKE